ncbi:MAG: hypothetical protein AB8B97_22695 [Granulosicoccus sp.]
MVPNSLVDRFTGLLVACIVSATLIAAAMPSVLMAQQTRSSDFESPIIEHIALDTGLIGGVEVFGATVVDNVEIEAVSLFYRFSGEKQFAELPMREIASSAFYSVKVDTANVPLDTSAIEYYLQAEDTSGNIVLKGFAFQPLLRTFTPSATQSVPQITKPAAPTATASKNLKWVYVAVGVLAVGVIAASLDSGSDGVSTDDDCAGGCPVNLIFERP